MSVLSHVDAPKTIRWNRLVPAAGVVLLATIGVGLAVRDLMERPAPSALWTVALVGAGGLLLLVGLLAWASRSLRSEWALARTREDWLRVTLASIGDAVLATDEQGRVRFMNAVAERLTGWTVQEAVGRPVEEVFRIVNEQTRRPMESPVQTVLREGRVVELATQTLLLARDGTERAIEDTGAPITDPQGRMIGVVLVFHDVTERRRAARRLRAEHEITRLLAESARVDEATPEVLRLICTTLEWDWGVLWQADRDAQALRYLASWGRPEIQGSEFDRICRHMTFAPGVGLPGRVWATGEPLWLTDVTREPNFPRAAAAAETGLHGAIAFPILIEREVLGVMEFFSRDVREPDYDLLAMMRAVGSELGQFAERKRAEAAVLSRARQQAVLAELSQRALTSRDLPAMLAAAVAQIAQTLEVEYVRALEWAPEQGGLLLRAGAGWRDGSVGRALTDAGALSEADYALQAGAPVIVEDLRRESRFGSPALLREHGIVSGVSVVIAGRGRPFGLLGAHSARKRGFTQDDVHFMQAVANMLAAALDQRRAEDSLYEEKERLAVTLGSIGDGVITTDAAGRVVSLNAVAEQVTGWPEGEARGRALPEVFRIVTRQTREPCANPVEQVLATGRIVELADPRLLLTRDARERVVADSSAPIRTKDGRIIGVVLVFRDVTHKVKMEEDLFTARKLESIGVLAGGIAHDFNNILTAILGNISLAKRGVNPEDRLFHRLAEAEKATLRATGLTQQLLTFAKGGEPVKRVTAVGPLLREWTGFSLHGSTVGCEFRVPDDLWAAEIDQGQISQVIHNLVLNAQQAMPGGGKITVSAENVRVGAAPGQERLPVAPGPYVKIEVRDRGGGIPPDNLPRVFDPYFTTKQKGSGLGLTTSYSVVKGHGGHITVASQLGAGTTVALYLPASVTHVSAAEVEEETTPTGHGRVLVMDDEEQIREMLAALLAECGYEAEVARDGAEAVALYERAQDAGRRFDLVIMDLTVPGGVGGVEALRWLRAVDPRVRAIVSSGYATDPVMANYREYGFEGRIAKPYRLDEVSREIRRVLRPPRPPD